MKILSVVSSKTIIQYFLHLCFFYFLFLTPTDIIEPEILKINVDGLDFSNNEVDRNYILDLIDQKVNSLI